MSMAIAILVRILSNDFVFFHMLCLMQSFILFFYHDCITKVSRESGSYRGTSNIGINMKYL